MSTPFSWQQWASDPHRKTLFAVSTSTPTTRHSHPSPPPETSQPTTATFPKSISAPPSPTSAAKKPSARPETTDVVARRLIGKALGINLAGREGEGERFGMRTGTRMWSAEDLLKKIKELEVHGMRESG